MRVSLVWNAPDGKGGLVSRPINGRIDPHIGRRALAQAGRWRQELMAHGEEDASWDWAQFAEEYSPARLETADRYAHYSLWAFREVQALMILEISGTQHRTREGLPQIYVENLAVNPGNRSTSGQPRKVRGCGAAMLTTAVDESRKRGWSGRVGLHSLPGAVGFYTRQGFKDLGGDPAEEGCTYMELGAML